MGRQRKGVTLDQVALCSWDRSWSVNNWRLSSSSALNSWYEKPFWREIYMAHFCVPHKPPVSDIEPLYIIAIQLCLCVCQWVCEWTDIWMGPGQGQSTVACHYHLVLYPSIDNRLQPPSFTIQWFTQLVPHPGHIFPFCSDWWWTKLNLRCMEFLCQTRSPMRDSGGLGLPFSRTISLCWYLELPPPFPSALWPPD